MRFFIVAVDNKWGIAKDHAIPWHYKEDFAFFKEKTMGATCVMGYNTYAEIAQMRKFPEKNKELLPGRTSYIVSSRDLGTLPLKSDGQPGIITTDNPDVTAFLSSSVAFIGGQRIYDYSMSTAIGAADYGFITRIKHDHDCNLFFNETLLRENFALNQIQGETDDLRFERWIRITKRDKAE
jgi:dihydrofolate reductase